MRTVRLYDIQSLTAVTEDALPGYGEIITQIWRVKQLEYTWLRSLAGGKVRRFRFGDEVFAYLHA